MTAFRTLLFVVTIVLRLHAAGFPVAEVAVIRQHFAPQEKEHATVVLSGRSSIHVEPGPVWKADLRKSGAKRSAEVQQAVEDFIAKNDSTSSFEGLTISGLRLLVIPEGDLRELFSDSTSGWDEFRRRFGTSNLFRLSRVGFSRDGHTAIYFAYVQQDWLIGHGEFHVVRFIDGAWSDTGESIGWLVHS